MGRHLGCVSAAQAQGICGVGATSALWPGMGQCWGESWGLVRRRHACTFPNREFYPATQLSKKERKRKRKEKVRPQRCSPTEGCARLQPCALSIAACCACSGCHQSVWMDHLTAGPPGHPTGPCRRNELPCEKSFCRQGCQCAEQSISLSK